MGHQMQVALPDLIDFTQTATLTLQPSTAQQLSDKQAAPQQQQQTAPAPQAPQQQQQTANSASTAAESSSAKTEEQEQ